MRSTCKLLAAAVAAACALPAADSPGAMHACDTPQLAGGATNGFLTVRASAGILEGQAHEFVYQQLPSGRRHKLSELVWDLSLLQMAGASLSGRIADAAVLNAGYWTAVNRGQGGMTDYDWYLYDTPESWTHRSRSSVDVTAASAFDMNASVFLLRRPRLAVSVLLGYRENDWQWEDSSTDFVYSSLGDPEGDPEPGYSRDQADPAAVRDLVFSSDGSTSVRYEQRFSIPYVGLGAEFLAVPFHVHGYVLYSNAARASDEDLHIDRGLLFRGRFSGGQYLAGGLQALVDVSPRCFAALAIDFQTIPEWRGDVTATETGSGATERASGGAGVSHESRTVSATLGWRL